LLSNEAVLRATARIWHAQDVYAVAIPYSRPYVVVASQSPMIGKQALPAISAQLRSLDIYSAWRLLPDVQIGIAHLPSDSRHDELLGLLRRSATTAVGVSAPFVDLSDTALALRYARIAMSAGDPEKARNEGHRCHRELQLWLSVAAQQGGPLGRPAGQR
jgi:hypothetical protein